MSANYADKKRVYDRSTLLVIDLVQCNAIILGRPTLSFYLCDSYVLVLLRVLIELPVKRIVRWTKTFLVIAHAGK